MIDLHCHILPGIDDGAPDLATSLAMARMHAEAGFKAVAATPHAHAAVLAGGGLARAVIDSAARLDRALRHHGICLKVVPGMEVVMEAELPAWLSAGEILPLACNNHLLVETPFSCLALGWQNLVFELGTRGITVIFAHPERCDQILCKPDLLEEMLAAGARLQVNWDSFGGAYGSHTACLARHMAEKGLIHCLATDSHDTEKRHPGRVVELYAELMSLVGEANLRRLSLDNPLRVLRGQPLLPMDPEAKPLRHAPRKRWWKWFSA